MKNTKDNNWKKEIYGLIHFNRFIVPHHLLIQQQINMLLSKNEYHLLYFYLIDLKEKEVNDIVTQCIDIIVHRFEDIVFDHRETVFEPTLIDFVKTDLLINLKEKTTISHEIIDEVEYYLNNIIFSAALSTLENLNEGDEITLEDELFILSQCKHILRLLTGYYGNNILPEPAVSKPIQCDHIDQFKYGLVRELLPAAISAAISTKQGTLNPIGIINFAEDVADAYIAKLKNKNIPF